MGSPVIYPETWIPYMTNKDCSQGLCSLYCPQWCDFVFPSPPPPPFQFPNQDSSTNFSPLVIAVIGILASALLLVSYYTLISKFCGRMGSRRSEIHGLDAEPEDEHRPSVREPWRVTVTGLDEALIKSIAVCRYKKGSINGELTGGVCSVCLGEFQEDESLRLLPKCSHAFHVPCIDTWLASHSNCPLCRSDIVFVANSDSSSAPLQPALATHNANLPRNDQSLPGTHQEIENHRSLDAQDSAVEEAMHVSNSPKTPSQEVGSLQDMQCAHTMIEVRDTESSQLHPFFRRSFSMGHSCRTHVSVADVLQAEDEEERLGIRVEECPANANLGTCKHSLGGGCR